VWWRPYATHGDMPVDVVPVVLKIKGSILMLRKDLGTQELALLSEVGVHYKANFYWKRNWWTIRSAVSISQSIERWPYSTKPITWWCLKRRPRAQTRWQHAIGKRSPVIKWWPF